MAEKRYLVVQDVSSERFWCEPVSRSWTERERFHAGKWVVLHEHDTFKEADLAADAELVLRAVHDS